MKKFIILLAVFIFISCTEDDCWVCWMTGDCYNCGGKGYNGVNLNTCSVCSGTGDCPACRGTGRVPKNY